MWRRALIAGLFLTVAAVAAAAGYVVIVADDIIIHLGDTVTATPRPPADYITAKWGSHERYPNCGIHRPPAVVKKLANNFHTFDLGSGTDTMSLHDAFRLLIFDRGSLRTAAEHDTLVLPRASISDFIFERRGPHLFICSPTFLMSLVVARHYCRGEQDSPPWNNEIEEIAFPQARETWLADDVFDELDGDDSFPGLERIAELYRYGDLAEEARKEWKVRPFRDVLPAATAAADDCRSDLLEILQRTAPVSRD